MSAEAPTRRRPRAEACARTGRARRSGAAAGRVVAPARARRLGRARRCVALALAGTGWDFEPVPARRRGRLAATKPASREAARLAAERERLQTRCGGGCRAGPGS